MKLNESPRLPALLRDMQMLPVFRLLDVGASGGIPHYLRVFGEQLTAIGFDPLLAEVVRLNEREENPNVRYEAAWIVSDLDPKLGEDLRVKSVVGHPFARSSAFHAAQSVGLNYQQEIFNSGKPLEFTENRYSLDQYLTQEGITDADFLKIDTDGYDLPVLLGARNSFEQIPFLGIQIEVQFHGHHDPNANVYRNIDEFITKYGLSLFELEILRYSRAALPARFQYQLLASTESGQVIWGDAVYLRDMANPAYLAGHDIARDLDKVLKLCCLFEIYGLPDCAAELLICLREAAGITSEVCARLLDALVPEGSSYDDYIARFDRDPRAFLPPP
jgi:FkbM family methyltransferase